MLPSNILMFGSNPKKYIFCRVLAGYMFEVLINIVCLVAGVVVARITGYEADEWWIASILGLGSGAFLLMNSPGLFSFVLMAMLLSLSRWFPASVLPLMFVADKVLFPLFFAYGLVVGWRWFVIRK